MNMSESVIRHINIVRQRQVSEGKMPCYATIPSKDCTNRHKCNLNCECFDDFLDMPNQNEIAAPYNGIMFCLLNSTGLPTSIPTTML